MDRLVDLSLKPEFVNRPIENAGSKTPKKMRKRSAYKDLEVNQTVNAVVEIVKENYLVLSIPDAKFAMGYASLSDYNTQGFQPKQFVSGQRVVASVMALPDSSTAERLLLLLKSNSEVMETSSSKRAKKKSSYVVGSTVQAEVTEIKPLELKLKSGSNFHGRIHITEATDDNLLEDPFSTFKIGQTITAKIVSKKIIRIEQYSKLFIIVLQKVHQKPENSIKNSSDLILLGQISQLGNGSAPARHRQQLDRLDFSLRHFVEHLVCISCSAEILHHLTDNHQDLQEIHLFDECTPTARPNACSDIYPANLGCDPLCPSKPRQRPALPEQNQPRPALPEQNQPATKFARANLARDQLCPSKTSQRPVLPEQPRSARQVEHLTQIPHQIFTSELWTTNLLAYQSLAAEQSLPGLKPLKLQICLLLHILSDINVRRKAKPTVAAASGSKAAPGNTQRIYKYLDSLLNPQQLQVFHQQSNLLQLHDLNLKSMIDQDIELDTPIQLLQKTQRKGGANDSSLFWNANDASILFGEAVHSLWGANDAPRGSNDAPCMSNDVPCGLLMTLGGQ
ncbi:hypothetical protein LXL04_004489 [Taraxacum kok-saghyz]